MDLVISILIDCSMQQIELITNDKPRTRVRFSDNCDNTLVFNLMFRARIIFSVEQIKSNLRYKILKAFQEYKIRITFPQRDNLSLILNK